MTPGRDPAAEHDRLTADADRLIADPRFQADADGEFAALLAFTSAVLAVSENAAAWPVPDSDVPP